MSDHSELSKASVTLLAAIVLCAAACSLLDPLNVIRIALAVLQMLGAQ